MGRNFSKELSIIVPVYNEEETIGELIIRICMPLINKKVKYELIVVDDNSTDSTLRIVKQFKNSFNIVIHKKRGLQGKAYSLYEGFVLARYKNLGFIDADLQYPPEAIPKMLEKLKESDVVSSYRKKYRESFTRKILSRSFKFVFGKLIFGLNNDIQSGLKLFKKEVLRALNLEPKSGWSFDLAFLHFAKEAGFKIKNHDITFLKRKKGDSKIGLLKTSYELARSAISLKFATKIPKPVWPDNANSMRNAGVRMQRSKFITHTTLPYYKSSLKTFTRRQKFYLTMIFTALILGLIARPFDSILVIIGILSTIYFIDTLFSLFIVLRSLNKDQELKISKSKLNNLKSKNLPVYTILCPLYKESHVIKQFIRNISKISWPKNKLDVILLLEKDDIESLKLVEEINIPAYIRVLEVPQSFPKTKPKACNYGLSYARGEYLVIYDAEDKPESDQLKKAYLAFQKVSKKVLCLQAKLNYYNPTQNLLTRLFTAEYSLWFDVTLTGLQSINTSIPLGGTSNHFRTKDLIYLRGWDPFNVTEDADLGVRLFKEGYKTAIIDSVTYEEANSKLGNWIRQRSRWIKGYMQTYLVHTRKSDSLSKDLGKHSLIFHLIIGGKLAFIFINPVLWAATISYFTLNSVAGPMIERLYPVPTLYIAVFSLVFGNFLYMYYYMIGVMKRKQYHLVKFTFLLPFYWILISFAGFIALYQLIVKPFYWEKTLHGLNIPIKTVYKKRKKEIPVSQPVYPAPAIRLYNDIAKINKPYSKLFSAKNLTVEYILNFFVIAGFTEKLISSSLVNVVYKILIFPIKQYMFFLM